VAVVVSHAFEADGYHKGDVGGARGDRRHAKTARRTDVIGHQNTTKKHDDSGCRWLDLNGLFLGSLKKRRKGIYRAVPVPETLIDTLDLAHGIREAHRRKKDYVLDALLWPIARNTAWRHVTGVMQAAGIPEGPHRCPKGLRHGYAIHALSKNVPLNMVSKWMGHSQMETTAIYANAVGEEQQSIAARMWA
jgi:integrase